VKYCGMLTLLLALFLLAPVPGLTSEAHAAGKTIVTADPLIGYQETPLTISSTGSGTFRAEIDEDSSVISFELTYQDLSSTAIFAHIHFSIRAQTGSVIAFLCGGGGKPACPAATADITGTITAADILSVPSQGIPAGGFADLVAAIRAGVTYVNVHTTNHPSGEIRGQVNNDNQREPR